MVFKLFSVNNGASSTCRREHGTYRDLNTTSDSIEGQDILNITKSLNISSNYTTTEKKLNNLLWNRGINIQKNCWNGIFVPDYCMLSCTIWSDSVIEIEARVI